MLADMACLRAEVLEILKCLDQEKHLDESDSDSFAIGSIQSHSTSLSPNIDAAEDPNLVSTARSETGTVLIITGDLG
jgi:hypothetical protein